MKKIKLIHILSNLSIGGAQMLVYDILNYLKSKDELEIVVITIDSGELLHKYEAAGLKVIDLKLKGLVNPKILFELKNVLRKIQPDIVHTHMLKADFYGRIAAKQIGVPLIVSTCHIDSTVHKYTKPGKKNIFDRIDNFVIGYSGSKLIAVSQRVKNYLLNRKQGLKDQDIEVIYNGVDIGKEKYLQTENEMKELRSEFNVRDDDFLIILPGRLEEQKGHLFFLGAIRDLLKENRNIKILFLGEGSKRTEIENFISKNELNEYVKILGFRQDAENFFEICDLVVLPSLWEGFGIVLIEAMIKRKIAFASNVGGIPEVVEDNKTGFLFESGNGSELVKKLSFIFDNFSQLETVKANALDKVRNDFDIKKNSDLYYNFYMKYK